MSLCGKPFIESSTTPSALYRAYLFAISSSEAPPSCMDLLVAAVTADIVAARNPPFSKASTPAIVVPPGLVTASFNSPGCFPVFNTISAAPLTVWAANFVATVLGKPALTPPSLNASMNWKT
eukprot:CAMPEP_0184440160 /NCGR_PEP_ID=MMETSP0738-20130409/753202_1 /TAXON_ID=385413 /ORGANISM="Thalassiosira miniscula, Strain CCMP1093" /LENGTH=121 /DNA_ID=CAMNT_0026808017 /DNA_START=94 /DNA_END=459 /DNA_ORIENTATION=+